MNGLSLRARLLLVVLTALVLGGVATAYAVSARRAPAATVPVDLRPGSGLLVVADGQLARASGGRLQRSAVRCVRVYASAGTGVCLHQDTPWTYSLHTLDASLRDTGSFPIPGLPNRARVSPSGRLVAWTSFISGESYAGSGFSTRTGILDTRTGARVDSLESFAVVRDGRPYRNADVNYWGVTFADDDRFYATLSTAGHRYLVEGDLAERRVRTLAEPVECPSLSPDGTRVAFKRMVGGDPSAGWRLSVLDLRTRRVTPLAEPRSVDDQPAWLSRTEIAYTLRDSAGNPSVWSVPADGSGAARRLLTGAESPSAFS